MRFSAFLSVAVALTLLPLPGCNRHSEEPREPQKIVVTKPQGKSVTVTDQYVCQIHAQRHIRIRALERGYLEEITIKEGQSVKKDDALFQILPVTYKAKLDVELAELEVAQMEYNYSKKLSEEKVVSDNERLLLKAKLSRAKAKADLARAEFNFTTFKAPFDGIIDRLYHQQGGLIEEGETLTSLSDNSVMWVYFNVPEAKYLGYMTKLSEHENQKVELMLADRTKFSQVGKISAIEADFNNQTGNIPFRADFPNPDRLLRHGQTGKILISRVKKDAIVIPQRATFQVLDKRYVYVVDTQDVAHQREIKVQSELEDVFVIEKGVVDLDDKIVLEGARQIRDGDKVEYEERPSEQVLANLKYHAE